MNQKPPITVNYQRMLQFAQESDDAATSRKLLDGAEQDIGYQMLRRVVESFERQQIIITSITPVEHVLSDFGLKATWCLSGRTVGPADELPMPLTANAVHAAASKAFGPYSAGLVEVLSLTAQPETSEAVDCDQYFIVEVTL